jgi:pimeloyl-ACP methyl ester carboxylesterase
MAQTFSVSGGRILAWTECGATNGIPFIFLHGAPGSVVEGDRSPYAKDLERAGFRMVAIERAGYGVSGAHLGRRVVDIASDVKALSDRIGLDRFAVVGWSSGGPHALAVAAQLPDRVSGVGTIACIAPLDKVGLDGLGERVFLEMAQGDPEALREGMRQLAASMRDDPEGTTAALFTDVMSDRDVEWLARNGNHEMMIADLVESARGDWHGYADDCIAFVNDWGFNLHDVRARVVMLHGDADQIVPLSHSVFLEEVLPNASLEKVEGEGHISILDGLPKLCAAITGS